MQIYICNDKEDELDNVNNGAKGVGYRQEDGDISDI